MASCKPRTTDSKLFELAHQRKIELASSGSINERTLGIKDAEGLTLLVIIAKNGQFPLVPKHCITQENITPLLEVGILDHLAAQGQLIHIPEELLTLASLTKQDKQGWTPLHAAAINGYFAQVPIKLITEAAMTIPTARGVTPIHLLLNVTGVSWTKFLEEYVLPFLNERTLFLECEDYASPILRLAERGRLASLPRELKTEALLLRKNSNGFCALAESAVHENIHELPREVLTFANLKDLMNSLCANRTWTWAVRTEALICMATLERKQWHDLLIKQASNMALTQSTRADLAKTAQEIEQFTHIESAGAWNHL